MKPLLRAFRCVAAVAMAGAFVAAGNAQENRPGFRRFPHTVSPDGAYVLAWGWGEEEGRLETLKEWPPGQDNIAGDAIANYLVDAVRGRVLAVIPEHDHYDGTPGVKRFSGLAVNWAEDGGSALAIYEGRWSDEAILWIRPRRRADTCVDVLPPLDAAYRRWLAQTEKVADAGEVSFSLPALLPGGGLVIDGRARPMVNRPLEYNHRLRFRVKLAGEKRNACW